MKTYFRLIKKSQYGSYDQREHPHYGNDVQEDWNNMELVFNDFYRAEYDYPSREDMGTYEEFTVRCPAKAGVCPVCQGKGKFVDPSIDSQGLTREDFEEDPDFKEDYLGGKYDKTCTTCNGRRVILVPADEDSVCARRLREKQNEQAELRSEQMSERRMGA